MNCDFCGEENRSSVGSWGFWSCDKCYNSMMDYLSSNFPKEMLEIRKIKGKINLLKEKEKEIINKLKESLKDNNDKN